MPRVLLTGATGFIGGRLVRALRGRDDEVVALVRTPSAELSELGVDVVAGGFDALSRELVEGVDAIVHAAAAFSDDPEVARAVNRYATSSLADHALATGALLVHVSTTAVYDLEALDGDRVDESAPLKSDDASAPVTSSAPALYAITKAEGERELAAAVERGTTVTVLRPPAVLGAGPTSTWGTTVPSRLRDGAWQPPHPETTFTWVHVDDLVDAILAALDRRVTTIANVIGGHTTFGRYVDALSAAVPGLSLVGEPSADARRWTGSYASERLPATLGVSPSRSFDDAMTEIAAWWRDRSVD